MRRLNPPLGQAELIARQARAHAEAIGCDWHRVFWPYEPPDQPPDHDNWAEVLAPFLVEHPMRSATQDMSSLHEAGHYIAFERLGMIATTAYIGGSTFGRSGWGGEACAFERAYRRLQPPYWDPDEFWSEAISAFAGPVVEELFGDGDALSSIGELLGACICAAFAARLGGENERTAIERALACAISLVEQYEPAIRAIAALLSRRKKISRGQPSVLKILMSIPQGPFDAAPLSASGSSLLRKIMTAFEELAPLIQELTTAEELAEAAL